MTEIQKLQLELTELLRQRDNATSNKYNYQNKGLSIKRFEKQIESLGGEIKDVRDKIKRLKKKPN